MKLFSSKPPLFPPVMDGTPLAAAGEEPPPLPRPAADHLRVLHVHRDGPRRVLMGRVGMMHGPRFMFFFCFGGSFQTSGSKRFSMRSEEEVTYMLRSLTYSASSRIPPTVNEPLRRRWFTAQDRALHEWFLGAIHNNSIACGIKPRANNKLQYFLRFF